MTTLYEWAGGQAAFDRLVNAFCDRVERDELLAPFFPGGVHGAHRGHVAAWWREVFGGPARYTEELGAYEHMLAKHRDLGITGEQRFRFASLMSLAADDAGLPDDPGVSLGARRLPRVGHAAGAAQHPARRGRRAARAGAALGLGRGASVRAVKAGRYARA